MFVRRDAHRNSLQCPYESPFRVIENGSKTFKIDMGGRTETITVDRLKLAHLDVDSPVQLAQPRPRGRPPGKTLPNPRPSTTQVAQRARVRRQIHPKSSPAPTPPVPPPLLRTRAGRQVRPNRKYISVRGGHVADRLRFCIKPHVTRVCQPFTNYI